LDDEVHDLVDDVEVAALRSLPTSRSILDHLDPHLDLPGLRTIQASVKSYHLDRPEVERMDVYPMLLDRSDPALQARRGV
jgi:hypothetical protein